MGAGVVVQEDENAAASARGAGIAGAGRAALTAVVDDLHPRHLGAQAGAQLLVVVDRDDHLEGRRPLVQGGLDRLQQLPKALLAVAGDDHAGRDLIGQERGRDASLRDSGGPRRPGRLASELSRIGHQYARTR
jgi:hypothetical protein